ncbi:3'(2'),5'-bisphosphate nucleotidase CysQ [Mycolicibacterium sp. S2-37]|uniref:3'(2'),5'-bisphosphate nucleotidase CysQ n=1 Tax=Mycolicibacterium sp. S2-37 TaxID=2810297 RepID=UPI001A9525AA|nr:3'(2'),5'-bisphosphate nucleotidase CysQ [Mycolicibacterium sp. S2-37]
MASDAELAAEVAVEAGELLVELRETYDYFYPYDLGDEGDTRANALILDRLHRYRPEDAVLSEEAVDDLSRVDADRVWIVDPVDGTREYSLPPHQDWAVHIALWQRGAGLTDAAVALPARGEVYRTDTVTSPAPRRDGPILVTASATRPPAVLWKIRDRLDIELVRIGSAGAKAMAVVRGDVDAYIHAGGQWEWDSAAPAAVVRAAGLHASRLDGSPLEYNRRDPYLPDLLMCRPELTDVLLAAILSQH